MKVAALCRGGNTCGIEHLTGLGLLPGHTREELKKAVASERWPKN